MNTTISIEVDQQVLDKIDGLAEIQGHKGRSSLIDDLLRDGLRMVNRAALEAQERWQRSLK